MYCTYDVEELEAEYPGPITNKVLLKSFSKYLREDDPTDPTNYIMRSKVVQGRDYKLLPLKCW